MKSTKSLTRKEVAFVDYLLMFYGPGGVYAGVGDSFEQPMTRAEAARVATRLSADKDFEGDTIDREKARDLVLEWRQKSS